MGYLKVTGKARKEYPCDVMHIKINFNSYSENVSKAVESSVSECDQFLALLENKGFDISSIQISYNSISHDFDDGKLEINSEREIEIRLPFDMMILNEISDIIKEHGFKAEMDVTFKVSDLISKHNVLLQEAVRNSKERAELIAESMCHKIIGIDSLDTCGYDNNDSDEKEYFSKHSYKMGDNSISNKLRSPVSKEYVSVEVKWIID